MGEGGAEPPAGSGEAHEWREGDELLATRLLGNPVEPSLQTNNLQSLKTHI